MVRLRLHFIIEDYPALEVSESTPIASLAAKCDAPPPKASSDGRPQSP
jgi:hypothetical protein